MSPERVAELVARWVRFYTRDLPAPVAQRRIDEVDADLHDHIAHERANGVGDRRIALGIASRMLRGLPADTSWRRRTSGRPAASGLTYRSAIRIALVTACVLLVPLVAMQVTDGAGWSLADFVLAAVLLGGTGLLLELAASRPASLVPRLAATVIAVAAIVLGEADDAPGLVLFGCLLIVGTVALTLRTALRST
jgi:hypothetical protein